MSENDAPQVSCCGRHGIVGCERCFGPYRVVRPMVRRTELDELQAERDSLVASLEEARENLEESKEWAADREEAVRQYANSLTVARAELSELRARVEAALSSFDENHNLSSIVPSCELCRIRSILSPPEAPTDGATDE